MKLLFLNVLVLALKSSRTGSSLPPAGAGSTHAGLERPENGLRTNDRINPDGAKPRPPSRASGPSNRPLGAMRTSTKSRQTTRSAQRNVRRLARSKAPRQRGRDQVIVARLQGARAAGQALMQEHEHAAISRNPEGTSPLGTLACGSRYRGGGIIRQGMIPMSGRQTGRGIKKPHSCDFARRGHHSRSFSCPSRATYGQKLITLRKARQESRVLFSYRSCIGASGVRLMRPRTIGRRGGGVRPSISSSSVWHTPACVYLDQQLVLGWDRIGKMVRLQRCRIVGQLTHSFRGRSGLRRWPAPRSRGARYPRGNPSRWSGAGSGPPLPPAAFPPIRTD